MTTITLHELSHYCDTFLESALWSDYCPNGLQIEGKAAVKKVGVAVSASVETIQAAVAAGVDALICHHGMFWKSEAAPIVGSKRQKVALLLEHGISLFGYHLPLDAHQTVGNNWKAARDLGLTDLEPFGVYSDKAIGVRGTLPELPRQAFQEKLEAYYNHTAHAAPGGKEQISTVAIVSGGAHNMISEAAQAGVDCFITGSFDEPVWHIANEEKINFFALGHSNTEEVGPKALGEHLAQHLGVEVEFLEVANPF